MGLSKQRPVTTLPTLGSKKIDKLVLPTEFTARPGLVGLVRRAGGPDSLLGLGDRSTEALKGDRTGLRPAAHTDVDGTS